MSETITLNSQQQAALDGALCWWAEIQQLKRAKPLAVISDHMKPVYIIAGLAGTGKTTLVKSIIKAMDLNFSEVQYIAPTGKAAAVLRRKGNVGACTLHRFAYLCLGEYENEQTGEDEPLFVARGALDHTPKLVVLDEGSMVSRQDREVLLSFNIPVIVLGDQGQLEPVKGTAGFELATAADSTLTEIMRQAEESNIIRAAGFVREGYQLPDREYPDVSSVTGYPSTSELYEYIGLDGASQIICGRNATRRDINAEVRSRAGFTAPLPMVGEKIICRFNDHNRGIMNGEQFTVVEVAREAKGDSADSVDSEGKPRWFIKVRSLDDGRVVEGRFNCDCFMADCDSEHYKDAMKSIGAWDFGYAITCHASQGSEWSRVMLIDEDIPGTNRSKWRYTGMTRAVDFLKYFK